jgi:2-methylaconitate cis-trans-isomerase PrpF
VTANTATGLLVTPDTVAVTLVLPAVTPIARPAVTVASAGTEAAQVALAVRLFVLPSL